MTLNIFIQARMGSTRLPGKMLALIADKTVLQVLVERLRRVNGRPQIILATSSSPENDVLESEARRLGIAAFRGAEENILDRLYKASQEFPADLLARVTGDCPLIDSALIDEGRQVLERGGYDMVSNVRVRSYPDGLDFELFKPAALERAWQAEQADERGGDVFINPTQYIHHQPNFKEHDLVHEPNLGELRLTLDHPEDLEVIRQVYAGLAHNEEFGLQEIVAFLQANPHIVELNKKYVQLDYGLSPAVGVTT